MRKKMTKADRRRERTSDLKIMVLATIAVLICMVLMLVWMHMTQEVRGQLDKLQQQSANGEEVTEEGRKRILRQRIAAKRTAAERLLLDVWSKQGDTDKLPDRTQSSCPPLSHWQHDNVPCTYKAPVTDGKTPPLTIVTEHFGPPKDFLLPHYDQLGTWLLSLQEPTLWNIIVNETAPMEKLYCADKWLDLTHTFDPLGSIESDVLKELDELKKDVNIPKLLKDEDFAHGMVVAVTHNVAAFADSNIEQYDQRLRSVFQQGMDFAMNKLMAKSVKEWEVHDIESIHRIVCDGEPDVENPGSFRRPTQHVGYGFLMPPPLGFELEYLMEVYMAWLKMASSDECSHPILLAVEAFARLHRMQPFLDCNTRVAKVVLNTVLLQHGFAPLHMFLGTSKSNLKDLQGQYYEGKPDALIAHLASEVKAMMHAAKSGTLKGYSSHYRS